MVSQILLSIFIIAISGAVILWPINDQPINKTQWTSFTLSVGIILFIVWK